MRTWLLRGHEDECQGLDGMPGRIHGRRVDL